MNDEKNNQTVLNLQKKCAEKGFELTKDCQDLKKLKIMLMKILGILRENGIYVFFLWLEERGASPENELSVENIAARNIYHKCLLLLEEINFTKPNKVKDFQNIRGIDLSKSVGWQRTVNLCMDIFVINSTYTPDDLFIIGDIFEQFLTYSLYKAKAGEKNG